MLNIVNSGVNSHTIIFLLLSTKYPQIAEIPFDFKSEIILSCQKSSTITLEASTESKEILK